MFVQIVLTFLMVSMMVTFILIVFGVDTTYKASAKNIFAYLTITGSKLVIITISLLVIFRIWFPGDGRIF